MSAYFYDGLVYICKVSVRSINLFELLIINTTQFISYQ